MALIASQLRKINIKVDILNLNHQVLKACRSSNDSKDFDFNKIWKTNLIERIKKFEPDFVGVTSMFSQSHDILVQTTNEISSLNKKIEIGIGGVLLLIL